MKTYYKGLTDSGVWVWFRSKKAVRNCKTASEICGEPIVQFGLAPFLYQIFPWLLSSEMKRGS